MLKTDATTIEFNFSSLYLQKNYLVNTVKEGVFLEWSKLDKFNTVLKNYYTNTPFVFISNRIHPYSLDPSIYKEALKILNISAFGIVSKNHRMLDNLAIEQLFTNTQFKTFGKLNDAIIWADSLF